ncbi:MAG: polysaccharide deacetylase family protein [Candidatus Omnitrophica bacterium]|nr:polysaccharide deacetylase family protein [Candidatus Omnitrophota bacterium]
MAKKHIKLFFIFFLLIFIAGASAAYFWISPQYVVPIMMYHQVEAIDHHEANWVQPVHFEQQMEYLSRYKYNVISLSELIDTIGQNKVLPRNTVVITFDDGYKNNYTNAFPILKKYQFPATVFMPSDKVGLEGRLSYKEIQEMLAHHVDFGSHTRTESYLPDLDKEQWVKEIEQSKNILDQLLGKNIDLFAYPIGGFSNEIKQLVKDSGYKGACTTNRGYDRYNRDVYELNRIRFSSKDDSSFVLWAKLSGYYNLFRKLKNPQ